MMQLNGPTESDDLHIGLAGQFSLYSSALMLPVFAGIPLASTTGVATALTGLFVLLVAAKAGEEIFKRINQPPVVGEILAGVIVGPSVLGFVELSDTIEVFAELGVIFVLFWVGLETKLTDITSVGRTALSVGTLGVLIPVVTGSGLAAGVFGEPAATSVFIGAALAATSVGITSAVLIDLGRLNSPAGRTILGAAVIDDVLALILLSVATGLAASGQIDLVEIVGIFAAAFVFIGFFALGGSRFMRNRPNILEAPRFAETPLMPAVILCLGLALLSAKIGLAAVVGAFLAGMMVAETKEQNAIESEIAPLYAFFAPFFFASIGLQVDLGLLFSSESLLLLIGITTLAIATKFAGAWLGARSLGREDAIFVGFGMVPRGEVGVIVAAIGHSAGVINDRLFAVIVGMAVLTTLIAPPILQRLSRAEPSG